MNKLRARNRSKIILSFIFSVLISLFIGAVVLIILLASEKIPLQNVFIGSTLVFFISSVALALIFSRKWLKRLELLKEDVPEAWAVLLESKVSFFNGLDSKEKELFLRRIQFFISEKSILPIETKIDEECLLLVAASAIIPVFALEDWEYQYLSTILIYPGNFDEDYQFESKGNQDNNILGMVFDQGSTMILSKPALYTGFLISQDKMNVGFHEFVHKIDGQDGAIDGLPALLTGPSVLRDFIRIRKVEMEAMEKGHSDINPYGLTNEAEFFAVVSEYFFENPQIMAKKHNELFQVMKKIFKQDPTSRLVRHVSQMIFPKGRGLSKNAPCPCGSGLKYKHCHFKKQKK